MKERIKSLIDQGAFSYVAVISAAIFILTGFSYLHIYFANGQIDCGLYTIADFESLSDGLRYVDGLGELFALGFTFFILMAKLAIHTVLSILPVAFQLYALLYRSSDVKRWVVYSLVALGVGNMLLLVGRNIFIFLPFDLLTAVTYLIALHYRKKQPLSPAIAFSVLTILFCLFANAKVEPLASDAISSYFLNLGLFIQYLSFWALATSTMLLTRNQQDVETRTGSSNNSTTAAVSSASSPSSQSQGNAANSPVDVETIVRQLKELKGLLDEGLLTPEEYDTYKQKVLGDNHEQK